MTKVAELIRVSKLREDGASIPSQKAICAQICARYELTVIDTIQMEDVSGAEIMCSPDFQRLISLVECNTILGIVTREWSRLLRPEDPSDYVIIGLLRDHKVKVYLPDGPADLTTPTGMFMSQVQLAAAAYERSVIRYRSMTAKEQMRREGRAASSALTWPRGVGYSKLRGWYYDDIDANRIEHLFTLFTGGMTSWKDLSEATALPYSAIHIILRNPIYMGVRTYTEKRDGSRSGRVLDSMGRLRYQKKLKREPDEIIQTRVIAKGLVSDETFAKAQQMLAIRAEMHHRRRKGNSLESFLYRGHLKCSICGEIMYCVPKRYGDKLREYYICRRKRGYGRAFAPGKGVTWIVPPGSCQSHQLARERMELILDAVVANRLTDPEFLDVLLKRGQEEARQSDVPERIESARREVVEVTKKRERLNDLYIDGKVSRVEHEKRLSRLDEQTRIAQGILDDLSRQQIPTEIAPSDLAELLSPFLQWEFLNSNQKRRLLRSILPVISVANYEIKSVTMMLAGEQDAIHDGSNTRSSSPLQVKPSTSHLLSLPL